MQLQPNTSADKDVAVLLCGSRDWTDEDAVRAKLERAVARFMAERLVVIAGGARGRRPPGRGVCPRAGLAAEVYRAAGIATAARRVTVAPFAGGIAQTGRRRLRLHGRSGRA